MEHAGKYTPYGMSFYLCIHLCDHLCDHRPDGHPGYLRPQAVSSCLCQSTPAPQRHSLP